MAAETRRAGDESSQLEKGTALKLPVQAISSYRILTSLNLMPPIKLHKDTNTCLRKESRAKTPSPPTTPVAANGPGPCRSQTAPRPVVWQVRGRTGLAPGPAGAGRGRKSLAFTALSRRAGTGCSVDSQARAPTLCCDARNVANGSRGSPGYGSKEAVFRKLR